MLVIDRVLLMVKLPAIRREYPEPAAESNMTSYNVSLLGVKVMLLCWTLNLSVPPFGTKSPGAVKVVSPVTVSTPDVELNVPPLRIKPPKDMAWLPAVNIPLSCSYVPPTVNAPVEFDIVPLVNVKL